MRRPVRWTLSVACGMAVGAGTHALTANADFALGNGVVAALSTAILLRASSALDAHVDDWQSDEWIYALVALLAFTWAAVEFVHGQWTATFVATVGFAYAVAAGGVGVGILVALESLGLTSSTGETASAHGTERTGS